MLNAIRTFTTAALVLALMGLPGIGSQWALNETQAQLTETEKKAQRNEMIEMDIHVRNISSMLALGDAEGLYNSFIRLANMDQDRPVDLANSYRSLYAKWKKQGVHVYRDAIQKAAEKAEKELAKTYRSPDKINWSSIETGFREIVTQCRMCHNSPDQPR